MHKLLMAAFILALLSFGIAWADDMDGGNVIREEHVKRNEESRNGSGSSSDTHVAREATRDDHDVTEAEHGQDLIGMRADLEARSHPAVLELDSLGLYFGLGEHFVDMANGLIDERMLSADGHGDPVYSRSASTAEHSEHSSASHNHSHESDSSTDDSTPRSEASINRRNASHDYFWD